MPSPGSRFDTEMPNLRTSLALHGMVWACLIASAAAGAHPLGNNTVNREAHLAVGGAAVTLDYLLELAEIPTLVASQDADENRDNQVSNREWTAHAAKWAQGLPALLTMHAGQHALPLAVTAFDWQLRDGAAGLPQLRLHAILRSPLPPAAGHAVLSYEDRSRTEDRGWREVWASTDSGARILTSNAASRDRSAGLTLFPPLGERLPDETTARLELALDPTAATARPPAGSTTHEEHHGVAPATPGARARGLFLLGVHHIATGWDHLVFLLGLLLLSRSLRDLLAIVSAFTLAHSLTLGLAAAGLVTPPGSLIEPGIALTIAYVGVCNLWFRGRSHGMPLAFGFGLVHGFGFAGALSETLGAQLAGGRGWLIDLATFNLGIESFQVALLCAVVPTLEHLRRLPWAPSAERGAAFGVLGAGVSWFVLRVSGW